MKKGTLFVVSAPSGAGKTSLVEAVIASLGKHYHLKRVVTYTTKQPRSTEKHEHDYHFVTKEQFQTYIGQGFFIEHSTAYGHYYGCPRTILDDLKLGISYIAILDHHGAQNVAKSYPQAVLIWVTVSDIEILKTRLQKRNTEKHKEIEKRLNIARKELENDEINFLYHHFIVNDSFDRARDDLQRFVENKITEE